MRQQGLDEWGRLTRHNARIYTYRYVPATQAMHMVSIRALLPKGACVWQLTVVWLQKAV